MKIVYFLSPRFDFGTLIYPGVGPHYAESFGWPTASLDDMSSTDCDVGIVDNRLTGGDFAALDRELASPRRRFPVLFKLSDPEAPDYTDDNTRYIFQQKDVAGVHYVSIYDLEGPVAEFVRSLRRSKVFRLPFPYLRSREVELGYDARRRRILLSGAQSRDYYPLRYQLRRRRMYDPLAAYAVSVLPHPGYPDVGQPLCHNITFDRFIAYASRFTHLFMCGTRYRVELMKYVECAHAGCVPIGEASRSLEAEVRDCLIGYSGRSRDLLKAVSAETSEMRDLAARYRTIMRRLRDPQTLVASFVHQMQSAL